MSAPVVTRPPRLPTAPAGRAGRPTVDAGPPTAKPKRRIDAVAMLSLFVFLTVLIPERLIIQPLGAAGTPAILVGLLCLLWWFYARIVPGTGLAKGYQPIRIALGVFVIACTLSYIFAFATRSLAVDEVNAADRAMIWLASFSGIVLLAADGIDRVDRLEVLLRRMVLFATIIAIFGFVQFFTGFDLGGFIRIPGLTPNMGLATEIRSNFRRVSVTAAHPIEYGVFLAMTWPIAVQFALRARSKLEVRRAWAATALISGALTMSLSRSAMLGAAAAGFVLALRWSWRRRANALVVITGFLVALRILVPGLVGTLSGLFTHLHNDSSYQARVLRYPIAYRLIHNRPIFGRGIATMLPSSRYGIIPLDNQLLKWTLETGVVGLAAVLLLLVVGMATAWGASRRSRLPENRELLQALIGSLLACGIAMYTFDAFSYAMVTGTLAIVLGCVGALWRLNHNGTMQPWPWTRHWSRRAVGAGLREDTSSRLGG